jgi:hypothetical protein
MRPSGLVIQDFSTRELIAAFEGGAAYSAERGDKFYVITDESTMADFLTEEDKAELKDQLVKILEFDSRQERDAYLAARGWVNQPHHPS